MCMYVCLAGENRTTQRVKRDYNKLKHSNIQLNHR